MTEVGPQNPRTRASEPVVSVIMPVFNAAASMAKALESVLAQSLRELEVLVVDDASTDHSVRIAEAVATRDDRVRLLRHERNQGQSAARNLAVDRARGTWVAPVDADDEITERRFERLSRLGEAADADLVADGVWFTGPRRPGTPQRLSASRPLSGEMQRLTVEDMIESDIPLNGICSLGYLKPLIRRQFLNRSQLRYDEDLRFAEDLNLYVRCLMAGARFLLHPEAYYVYNQTPVSASRSPRVLPQVADHALMNNDRLRALARQQSWPELEALLLDHRQRWSTVLWFNYVKLAFRQGRFADAAHLMMDCPSNVADITRFVRDRMRDKRRATREA